MRWDDGDAPPHAQHKGDDGIGDLLEKIFCADTALAAFIDQS